MFLRRRPQEAGEAGGSAAGGGFTTGGGEDGAGGRRGRGSAGGRKLCHGAGTRQQIGSSGGSASASACSFRWRGWGQKGTVISVGLVCGHGEPTGRQIFISKKIISFP